MLYCTKKEKRKAPKYFHNNEDPFKKRANISDHSARNVSQLEANHS